MTNLTIDSDEQHRSLTIARALLDQASDHLERLDQATILNDDRRRDADQALELVLLAREQLGH
ncbi:MAG TPA: hypothetical protein VH416_02120 [Gaiellaceae bacterium]|jgi:hypothetical protein